MQAGIRSHYSEWSPNGSEPLRRTIAEEVKGLFGPEPNLPAGNKLSLESELLGYALEGLWPSSCIVRPNKLITFSPST